LRHGPTAVARLAFSITSSAREKMAAGIAEQRHAVLLERPYLWFGNSPAIGAQSGIL
jgi:hypothetical protein